MKPFLLLQLRPEADAAENEQAAFLRFGGLAPEQLHTIRMDVDGLPSVDLDDYSGVLVGGGPSNVSDAPDDKPAYQQRFEAQLLSLLDEVIARDFPFMGSCYGVGIVGAHQGGVISRMYPESPGASEIRLTDAGRADPLLTDLQEPFTAFVGHKECCEKLPDSAVLLASSEACPVQMFRVGANVYATQFHTELDADGLATRIRIYRYAGYFPPDAADTLITASREVTVTEPMRILRRFVERYAT